MQPVAHVVCLDSGNDTSINQPVKCLTLDYKVWLKCVVSDLIYKAGYDNT